MRLLLVTDAIGGVWVYSLELARALRPLGIETVLAVAGPPPAKRREEAGGFKLIDTGLPLDWLDTSSDALRRAAEALANIARSEGADVVQTSSAALLADAEFAQPCVAVQHSCLASWWAAVRGTSLPPQFEWRRELVQQGLERAAAVVAPSLSFAAATARIYGLGTVNTVHNGRRTVVPPEIPQGEFVFTAGRLWDEGKNIATLDLAAARVSAPFQAAGATTGPNGARVALRHIDALDELGATRLAGLFAARPIYASAALYEPFGLSVLEAAQAGCALVLSDIPTHRELWDGAAIFVQAHDDESFAAVIDYLFEDADEREELGQLARARASHYTPERMARGMAEIYARIAAPAVAPQPMAGVA